MAKSKRLQPITQREKTLKLKPDVSRRIINKFHHFLKARKLILEKLDLGEDYIESLRNHPRIHATYSKSLETPGKVVDVFQEISKLKKTRLSEACEPHIKLLLYIDAQIEAQGGLKIYQIASLNGQNKQRGSDSSKKLIEWLKELGKPPSGSRALEIGCLSSRNYITTSNWFSEVIRIDLNSQEPGKITQQDFMKRPIPNSRQDRFDCISLSLVLNFVPSAKQRGDMLKRLACFYRNGEGSYPCLFFVLPLPCITNSKYINKERLLSLMEDLGYTLLRYHESTKLVYMLMKYNGSSKQVKFRKKELEGRKAGKNNFSIVVE